MTPDPVRETGRIRWEKGQWGNLVGYVGTLEPWAFQIWLPDDTRQWTLITALPTQHASIGHSADQDEMKAEAERWLEEFVTSLGAIFPAESSDEPEAKDAAR